MSKKPQGEVRFPIPNHDRVGTDLVLDPLEIKIPLVLFFPFDCDNDFIWFDKALNATEADIMVSTINNQYRNQSAVQVDVPLILPAASEIRQLCSRTGISGFDLKAKKRRAKLFLQNVDAVGGASNE